MWTPTLARRGGPIYAELAGAIASAVREGALAAGDRLPPQRALAESLGVNLTTVTRAYALATEMGVVAGEVGRGTYVRMLPDHGRVPWPGAANKAQLDMSSNFPSPTAGGNDLARALAPLQSMIGRDMLRYQSQGPNPAHLGAGAQWLKGLGLTLPAERLLITSGAINGVFLSLLTLCRPGDVVLMEDLASPALIGACSVLGLRAEGVAMDRDGIAPESLDAALTRTASRALVLVPNLQNPTLAIMSEARRITVAAILRRHGAFAIEDDAYGALLTESERPPPLAALAPDRVCYVTSLSKAVAPGLRVGFLAVPPALRGAAVDAGRVSNWMVSPLLCQIATHWINDGTAQLLARRQRAEASARQKMAAQILAMTEFAGHDAALHIWLRLPDPWRAEEFAAHASEKAVAVLPSAAMAVGAGRRPAFVRVSLCNDEIDLVQSGLERLATLLT